MKNLFIGLFVLGMIVSCQEPNPSKNGSNEEPVIALESSHADETEGLSLNEGKKWQSDSATLRNVANLQKILVNAKKEKLEDYSRTANNLQEALGKMFRECTMIGSEHEALHQWLKPIMDNNKAMMLTKNLEEAFSLFDKIEIRINLFPKFFE